MKYVLHEIKRDNRDILFFTPFFRLPFTSFIWYKYFVHFLLPCIMMNNSNFENFIQYNTTENSVNVAFGRPAEYYLNNHPLLKNIRLKSQSRKKTPELIKKGFISIERIEGAVDFIEWTTKTGQTKSTNRIDDIIKLTEKGEALVKRIEEGMEKDKSTDS